MFVGSLIRLPSSWARKRSAARRLEQATGKVLCPLCAGTGRHPDIPRRGCLGCHGEGLVKP